MQREVNYPSALQQRVLAQEAPGDTPVRLNIVIPSVTGPGKAFEAKVSILDATGYPSLHCEEHVEIHVPGSESVELAFRIGIPAVGSVKNIHLSNEGVFRLSATYGNIHVHSNPTLCTSMDVPGIFWGDPHVHTILSNCHRTTCRSLNFCFTAARYMSALDWVAAADHVSNGRCDLSKWKEQQTVANLYNDPEAFVTLPAYEASFKGGSGGDNNVYMSHFPDTYIDEYESGTPKTLCNKLAGEMQPDAFFVVPHHTTRTGKHGEISEEIYPGPKAMPVVEIHSKWGTSEYRGNPNPLHKIHEGPSYAEDMLKRGMMLGFIAGTDSHATMPSGGGEEPAHLDRLPGLTAIRSNTLTRQSVFDAIRQRHCYAASLERVIVHGTIAGCAFGEVLKMEDVTVPPKTDVLVAAQSDIIKIELVRNGEAIHTVSPNSWQTKFLYEDQTDLTKVALHGQTAENFVYYYIRVTCESGAQAWSSPVWLV